MAGAGYLPVDPEAPFARKKLLFQESEAIAVISGEFQDCKELAISLSLPQFVAVPSSLSFVPPENAAPPSHLVQSTGQTPSSLAMLMYTSGTSGVPKGIIYDHRHLLHGTWFWAELHNMDEKSVQLLKSPYFWAVMEWEFFPALLRGGSLVVAKSTGHKEPEYLVELIQTFQVNLLMITPSVLELLLDLHEAKSTSPLQSLQQLTAVGEAFPTSLANRATSLPDFSATVRNIYGASESSCTVYTVPRAGVDVRRFPKRVPAGLPQEHSEVYIMRAGETPLRLVNPGEAGEICFGGVLAAGYFKLPQLTEQQFVETPHGRLYRTGDMGRWNNGFLEVTGRIDRQVKVSGVRINPEEIEAVLLQYNMVNTELEVSLAGPVAQAAVVASSEPADLVAFVVPRTKVEVGEDELKAHCRNFLAPAYLPKHVVMTQGLPTLANGKVDYSSLQKMANEIVELLGAETVEDSLGRMKSLSKDALLETAVIHRCYAYWMLGVLVDHMALCSTTLGAHGCCAALAVPARVKPWTELLIRSFGNIQCMLGFFLMGAFQESRNGRITLGWVDVYMLALSMAIVLPLPQLLNVFGGLAVPNSYYDRHLGWDLQYMQTQGQGARWYLNEVVIARVFLVLCRRLRIPPALQVCVAAALNLLPGTGISICVDKQIEPILVYLTAWLWSCEVWAKYKAFYLCWYVFCFHYSRPCLKRIQALAPRGFVWGALATSVSMTLGLFLAWVDYPNDWLISGIIEHWSQVIWSPLYVLQVVLFIFGTVYWKVDARFWGNTTLGLFVAHIFVKDWFTSWAPHLIEACAWDPTGLVLYFAILLVVFALASSLGPAAHYILTAPQRFLR